MAKSPTRPSTPRLSELAKHVAVPSGVTASAWPAVEAKCAELGLSFRPWQVGAGRLILAKRTDGKYAATIGGSGLSIPRQVGKTFLVGAIVFALALLNPGLTVIWTSHRLRTSGETFKKLQGFARRRAIKPHVLKVVLGSGDEEIVFRNGSRILFGARERGFGRGFDEVDVLIFDEAQILTDAALDDMIPATNQSRQSTGALLIFMGTPPKPTDASAVFTRMRHDALTGADEDTAWVEFGAADDYLPTPLPEPLTDRDWEQVAVANPSFPGDTPAEAILRMRKKLGPDSFVREGLGIWDAAQDEGIFPNWPRCKDSGVVVDIERVAAIGLAGTLDGLWGSIGAAQVIEDDRTAVGMVDRRERHDWLVDEAKRIQDAYGCDVAIDRGGPVAHLIPRLKELGVRLSEVDTGGFVAACAGFWESVNTGYVVNPDHPELSAQMRSVRWRSIGERRAFGRKSGDIDLVEAVALAAYQSSLAPAGFNVW